MVWWFGLIDGLNQLPPNWGLDSWCGGVKVGCFPFDPLQKPRVQIQLHQSTPPISEKLKGSLGPRRQYEDSGS